MGAFFSAALFASFPLHPEVVSWIIARVDSVATAFFLCSFWLYLRFVQNEGRKAVNLGLSLLSFAIGLLSKEIAITLPLVLVLWSVLNAPQGTGAVSRMRWALHKTWPYFAMLCVYLCIRTSALGTFSGGYAGSIGQGLSASLWKRWLSCDSFLRVLFPFNDEVFAHGDPLRRYLRQLYQVAAVVFVMRAFFQFRERTVRQWLVRLGFASGWFVLSLMPAYQVWNLTSTLQGSRFIYLSTAPLCLLITLIVFPAESGPGVLCGVTRTNSVVNAPATLKIIRYLHWGSIVLLSCLVVCFAAIAYRNNLPWHYAGLGVRALRDCVVETMEKCPGTVSG